MSGGGNSDCVEVAVSVAGAVARDSKHTSSELRFSVRAWKRSLSWVERRRSEEGER